MRKLIAAVFVLMTTSPVVFAAERDTVVPLAAKPLVSAVAREAMRVALAPHAVRQTPPAQSPTEEKRWMERHPVWFGLMVGAGVGATWGALSCRDGCFPIGAGGAAMVGSWWGAGPGALIGWGVGRSK